MKIAIHQPNFFPHKAFFDKMAEVDLFVLLGNCQFEKNGYQNRFNRNGEWNTMSVSKSTQNIVDKEYINHKKDWNKIKRNNDYLEQFDDCISNSLYITNVKIIREILNILDIKAVLVSDYITKATKTKRLVDLCKHYDADIYLSGPSGKDYLDLELFDKAGLKVEFQEPSKSIPILDVI